MCRLAKSSLTEVGTLKLNLPEEIKKSRPPKVQTPQNPSPTDFYLEKGT